LALGHFDDTSERLATTHNLISENLLHVRAEHTHIELVINTSSVDSVLEETKDLLPGWRLSLISIDKTTENLFSSFKITIGELIVLHPSLGNEFTPLLDQGMEPREQEHKR